MGRSVPPSCTPKSEERGDTYAVALSDPLSGTTVVSDARPPSLTDIVLSNEGTSWGSTVNKYRRKLAWSLGPIAILFLGFTIFAAATGFVSWLPPLIATICLIVGGTVIWISLRKASR